MMRAENVTLTLQSRTVLKEVSFALQPGELTLMIGPNGAGKSSMIRLLAGLTMPDQGAITFKNTPLHHLKRSERAKNIAFLPQDNSYAWAVSVHDIVALGRMPHGEDPRHLPPSAQEAVWEAMAALDLIPFKDRLITQLSTGERARVFLSRALATKAPVLLVDEPVAALDPAHALTVLKVLRRYARAGHSVLAILHDLPLAALYADNLLVLKEGYIVAEGAPSDILDVSLIRQVFDVDAAIENKEGKIRLMLQADSSCS
jgi:iron complex transport system ATP-binding protein